MESNKQEIVLIVIKSVNMDLIGHISDAIGEYCIEKKLGKPFLRNDSSGNMEVYCVIETSSNEKA